MTAQSHTLLYGLVQLAMVAGGVLGIIQGASGRCWLRAMGFRTPL